MGALAVAGLLFAFLAMYVVIIIALCEQRKRDIKDRIMSERRKYDEALERWRKAPLKYDYPKYDPEIWHRSYDWL